MGLNISKGNMYDFVTHTWNIIKGKCYHDCSYCYMKRWGNLKSTKFDEKELNTDLGKNNFIFVGSSCDMFSKDIPVEWIMKTLEKCSLHSNNYLFQSKNPLKFMSFLNEKVIKNKSIFCTTIESNRIYNKIMVNSPSPEQRSYFLSKISKEIDVYITIEPIIDFDLFELVDLIKSCNPIQVNIGADSCGHRLPEPNKDKIYALIYELLKFTKVKQKKNLNRLL